jgi:hypothetical protein
LAAPSEVHPTSDFVESVLSPADETPAPHLAVQDAQHKQLRAAPRNEVLCRLTAFALFEIRPMILSKIGFNLKNNVNFCKSLHFVVLDTEFSL